MKKLREKETDTATRWRKIYNTFSPLRTFLLCTYICMTFIEKPAWCISAIDKCKNGIPEY
jgi:hypothetical protein